MHPEFGERLRVMRKMRGETLEQVARATQLSIAMLSRVERGERLPSPAATEALAHHFGLPPEELLGETIANRVRDRYGERYASNAAEHIRSRSLGDQAEYPLACADSRVADVTGERADSPVRDYGGFRARPIEELGRHSLSAAPPMACAASLSFTEDPLPEEPTDAAREAAEALELARRAASSAARNLARVWDELTPDEQREATVGIERIVEAIRGGDVT